MASTKLVTDKVSDPRGCLNLDHELWCNPWDKRLASRASFPDLFRYSLLKSNNVYAIINEIISLGTGAEAEKRQEQVTRLLDELGSYSYHSGLLVTD